MNIPKPVWPVWISCKDINDIKKEWNSNSQENIISLTERKSAAKAVSVQFVYYMEESLQLKDKEKIKDS